MFLIFFRFSSPSEFYVHIYVGKDNDGAVYNLYLPIVSENNLSLYISVSLFYVYMAVYDTKRYKQIMLNVTTKESLDRIKEQKGFSSYNETVLYLTKHYDRY